MFPKKEYTAARTALELLIDAIRNPHNASEFVAVYAAENALATIRTAERLALVEHELVGQSAP